MMWKIGSGSGHAFIGWLDGFDTTNRSIVQQESRVIHDENSCLSWVMPSHFNPALPPEKQCQYRLPFYNHDATNLSHKYSPISRNDQKHLLCKKKKMCLTFFHLYEHRARLRSALVPFVLPGSPQAWQTAAAYSIVLVSHGRSRISLNVSRNQVMHFVAFLGLVIWCHRSLNASF